jgi:hypothetical protein
VSARSCTRWLVAAMSAVSLAGCRSPSSDNSTIFTGDEDFEAALAICEVAYDDFRWGPPGIDGTIPFVEVRPLPIEKLNCMKSWSSASKGRYPYRGA